MTGGVLPDARHLLIGISAGLAVAAAGGTYTPHALGLLFNHCCDAFITVPLTDRRLALRRERVRNYVAWAGDVPQLVPTLSSLRRYLAPAAVKAA